jgi:translocation and assembly module TamB
VTADVNVANAADSIEVAITGGAERLSVGQPIAQALLGPRVSFGSKMARRNDGTLSVSNLSVVGKAFHLSAQARLAGRDGALDARYRLRMPKLSVLSKAAGAPLAGRLVLDGTAQGEASDPTVEGTLALTGLQLEADPLGTVELSYAVRSPASAARGMVSMAAQAPFGNANAATDFALVDNRRLELTQLSVRGLDTALSGEATIPLDGAPIRGVLRGGTESLSAWSRLAGVDLDGSVDLDLQLRPDEARQAADLRVSGRGLTAGLAPDVVARLGQLEIAVQATDLMQIPRATANVAARELAYNEIGLETLSVRARGDPTAASVEMSAAGDLRGRLDFDLAARVERDGPALALMVDRFAGTAAGQPVALQQPLTLRQGPNGLAVEDLALEVAGGLVAAAARMEQSTLEARLQITDLPLSLAEIAAPELGVAGKLDASAQVQGPTSGPDGEFRLELAGVRLDDQGGSELPALSGDISGRLGDGRLTIDGAVTGFAKQSLTLSAALPMAFSTDPFAVSLPPDQPVEGWVAWNGEIGPVAELVPAFAGNRLAGAVALDFALNGTLAKPRVSGRTTWRNGEFENFEAGTLLQGINVLVEADGTRIGLARAEASDGGTGRLSAEGSVDVDPEGAMPVDLQVSMNQATLVRRDDVTATATGQIGVIGTMADLLLKGRIEANSVEVQLVDTLPPQVVELDVIEVTGGSDPGAAPGQDQAAKAQDGQAAKPSVLRLDLKLALPGRVFIRGRGLESEWGGEFHITGTADNPVIEGALKRCAASST